MLSIVLALSLSATSRVARVVVYPDRATVTRSEPVACGSKALASFEALPPGADVTSFRAFTSVGSIEGLRVEEKPRDAVLGPEARDLEARIRAREAEAAALRDQSARLDYRLKLARQYDDVAVAMADRELAEPSPNVKAFTAALDQSEAARLKAAAERVELAAKARDLAARLRDLQDQQQRLGLANARKELVAEVLVRCPDGATAQVDLSYLVGGASWSPAYEARADEATGHVELTTFATVAQQSGEDWRGAQIVLSTAVPRQNATPPEVSRLAIWSEERKEEKKVIVRREETVNRAQAPGEAEAGKDTGGLAAAAQGLSVQLTVPGASDVPGDGTPARLMVAKTRLKAKFAWRTAPSQAPFVFRVASLNDTAPFPLLPGKVDLFRKGSYMASLPLERVAEGARFELTFGAEEALRVKRTVLEELEKDKGLFGTSKRFRYAYRFELSNFRKEPVEVELADRVPLSELEDVKVAIDDKTTPKYREEADSGKVTWRAALKPGEKKTYELWFHVDVPGSYDAGGM